jgi:hypothetical protein
MMGGGHRFALDRGLQRLQDDLTIFDGGFPRKFSFTRNSIARPLGGS